MTTIKRKKTIVSFMVLAVVCIIIGVWYYLPFIALNNLKQSFVQKDKATFNANVDFEFLKPNIENEFRRLYNRKLGDYEVAESVSKKISDNFVNSTDFFNSKLFQILQIRMEQIKTSARYVRSDQVEVKFTDKNRAFEYPDWILCKRGFASWALCEISLQDNYLDSQDWDLMKPIFDTPKKMERIKGGGKDVPTGDEGLGKKILWSDAHLIIPDSDAFSFIEFQNLIRKAYSLNGFKTDTTDKENPVLVANESDGLFKYIPKAGFGNDGKFYLVFDRVKADNKSFPDCHACGGDLSIVVATINESGLTIIKKFDHIYSEGVWGNSGTVVPVVFKDDKVGILVYGSSMWQGEVGEWSHAFVIEQESVAERKISYETLKPASKK